MSFIVAGSEISSDTVGKDETLNLTITCSNCTYVNLSYVKYVPTGQFILLGEYSMDNNGNTYYYEFSNTSELGFYEWGFHGDVSGGIDTPSALQFEVTPGGFILSEGSGNIYSILFIGALVLFIISLYYGLTIPWQNNKSEDGDILSIDYKKYLKMALLFISYLILTFTFAIGKGMAYDFLRSDGAYGFFNVGLGILLIGIMPVFIAMFYFIIASALFDKKVQKAIERGLPVR